jgi:hypothetical protein
MRQAATAESMKAAMARSIRGWLSDSWGLDSFSLVSSVRGGGKELI